jgi:hypothetical protein
MVITYCVMAGITFIYLLVAFSRDRDALKQPEAIPFILVATLLCPITLPCIVFSKVRRFSQQRTKKSSKQSNDIYSVWFSRL